MVILNLKNKKENDFIVSLIIENNVRVESYLQRSRGNACVFHETIAEMDRCCTHNKSANAISAHELALNVLDIIHSLVSALTPRIEKRGATMG